jgi:uracil-DNA glycosylase
MGKNTTIQSVSWEFVRTLEDLSQYLSHQMALGNTDLILSREGQNTMDNWGRPSKPSRPFLFQGPKNADLFFIDSEGSFFKGKRGELLGKILAAMHTTPESVFICNASDKMSMQTKIQQTAPRVLITLGQQAGQLLLNTSSPINQFQGKLHTYDGIPVMPTFHPSVLLEQPVLKRKVWEDMQQVMHLLGRFP